MYVLVTISLFNTEKILCERAHFFFANGNSLRKSGNLYKLCVRAISRV
jgi:hypothetical protein